MLRSKYAYAGNLGQPFPQNGQQFFLPPGHLFYTHFLLQLNAQRSFDRLQNRRRTSIFPCFNVFHVLPSAPGVRPVDSAAPAIVGHFVLIQPFVKHQHTGGTRPTQKLMRRKVDGVQVCSLLYWVHVHGYIGCRAGEVHKTIATMAMHDLRNIVVGSADARHIGAGSNGGDLQRPGIVAGHCFFKQGGLYLSPAVGWHHYHIGSSLQPASLIGVMLHMGDKNNRPFFLCQLDILFELLRHPQAQDALQLVHHLSHARSRRNKHIICRSIHMGFYQLPGFLVCLCHKRSRMAGFGVRVGHQRHDLPQQLVFNRPVTAPAGRPVGVQHADGGMPGRGYLLVSADNIFCRKRSTLPG